MIRVLAVEDSHTQAAMLSADLKEAGFEVLLARSGAEALGMLDAESFDLIVSDVVMPGMTGYELCRRVKDDSRTSDVPVILLTSLTDPLDVVRGLESGADNFLRKPYKAEQLTARCRGAVDNSRLREADHPDAGVRLSFHERQFDITAGRHQMLDLLISTFEELVETSGEVRAHQDGLVRLHADLEQQLHVAGLERNRLQAVVDSVPVPLFVIAPSGRVSHASQATSVAFGTTVNQLLGQDLDDLLTFVDSDGTPIPRHSLPHHAAIKEGRTTRVGAAFDVFLAHPEGKRMPVVLEASPVFDDQSRTAGCVATAHVVGALTQHDPVTGLPNNAAYLDRAAKVMGSSRGGCAIMLLELDRFDVVRASLGNTASDALLGEASRRLRRIFQPSHASTSSGECFVAYLGGSQFGVILTALPQAFSVLNQAESVRRVLGESYAAPGNVRLRVSVGVAVDTHGQGGNRLFGAARAALHRARETGGDRVEVLGEAASEQAMNHLQLEIDLRKAVDGSEIQLHYQPEVDLRTGKLIGFEALARWQHSQLGAIPPDQFIPLAEESGVILPLGRQLLGKACTQAYVWQQVHPSPDLSLAVNISARQLREGFVEEVTGVLTSTGLEPTTLVLEVTETAAMHDPETTVAILDELRSHGVRFSLDDFGTGYSSMAYLTRMRFDQLKLDRGFVEGMSAGGADAVVAQSIVALGQSLDIPVLAEGIERKEQADMLLRLGCEQGQGYLFSRPLSVDSAGSLLDQVGQTGYVLTDDGSVN
jgi:diguanylate cyclase (GGDEF)-like protein